MAICECGCGETVTKGRRFRLGHWMKTKEGALRNSETHLKDAPTDHGDGYLTVNVGFGLGQKLQHRVAVEKAIGRSLLDSEIVHHKDRKRSNNDPSNLVICKDDAEHQLIHLQERALAECGHADWRKCSFCKQWDDPKNLYIPAKGTVEHRACGREYRKLHARKTRANKKANKKANKE